MKQSSLRIERLIALDWFDGPVEAIAVTAKDESLHVKLAGDPPITANAVFRVWRLAPSTFAQVLADLEQLVGPAASPTWIPRGPLSPQDAAHDEIVEHRLAHFDRAVGYVKTNRLVGVDLDVIWLDREVAYLGSPGRLWEDVLRVLGPEQP